MGMDFGSEGDVLTNSKPVTTGLRDTIKRLKKGGSESRIGHRASIDWRLDQREVCAASFVPVESVSIEELKEIVAKSRTGLDLLEDFGSTRLSVVYDAQTAISQYYPGTEKAVIALNPHRPKGDLINLLTRELRRAWQHKNGALINPLSFEPDDAILVNRAQQADVLMMAIKIAWELKLAGEPEAWDYLVGSPTVADVGRVFEEKVRNDFRTLNDGEAARTAYDKFFEDSRTKSHDKRIIHQMLLNETGYIKSIGKHTKLSMDLFTKLGQLPNGSNYLLKRSKRPPTDLAYATVEDRSNANFLWFIKFERSFQEKESKLIEESVKMSAEVVDFAKYAFNNRQHQSA